MNVQVDGRDVDVRVLRLGPNDRLAVQVELASQQTYERLHKAIAHWSGLHPDRVIILHKDNVQLSVVSPQEPPEPGNGSEVAHG